MMRYEGLIDRPLYRRFVSVHTRSIRWIAILWLLACLYAFFTGNQNNVGVIVFCLFAVLMITLPWWGTWRAFKTNKFLGQPYHGEADSEAVTINSSTGTSRIPWTMFYRRHVTKNLALLYPVGQMAYVFAPSFFASAEDWEAFTRLVREKVPAKRGRFILPIVLIAIVILAFLVYALFSSD